MECLNRMEAIPPVAMFFRACELQERCGGLHLRDLLAMPLQVFAPGGDVLGLPAEKSSSTLNVVLLWPGSRAEGYL